MRYIKYFLLGIFFGIILTKAEVVSWYRIYEMFRFESFHMYGVIGSAVVLGAIVLGLSKKRGWKSVKGKAFDIFKYPMGWKRYLFGGSIFGLGWAMTGACPAPMFILIGNGATVMIVAVAGALLGTILYGMIG